MSIRSTYRKLCDEIFETRSVNNPDDDESVITLCCKLMNDAGYPTPDETEDQWLEFIYRANELIEIAEKGHVYIRVHDVTKRSGYDWVQAPHRGKL